MRTKIRRRPNGRWYVMTVDPDGTEHGHGGHRTQREAKAAAAALRTDSARGTYVRPERLTVAEYLRGEWLASRENAHISLNTLDTDRTVVEAWIVPWIGDVPLQGLSLATSTACTASSARVADAAAAGSGASRCETSTRRCPRRSGTPSGEGTSS
jgi:hypothetical protein